MDNTLQRLLDAESAAEKLVEEARAKRAAITRQAVEESRRAERRFTDRASEIHDSFLGKARERANQSIAELQRRYDERTNELRKAAAAREEDAVEALFEALTDPDKV